MLDGATLGGTGIIGSSTLLADYAILAPGNNGPAGGPAREQPKPEEEKKPSWRDRLKSARDLIGG